MAGWFVVYSKESHIDYTVMALEGLWWVEDSGDHHEIYLSDPRRSAPEKLKTVLRHSISA